MGQLKVIKSGTYEHKSEQGSSLLGILGSINHVNISEMVVKKDKSMVLVPATSSRVEEFFYILEGQLLNELSEEVLIKGDSMFGKELDRTYYFKTLVDTRVLYLSHETIIQEISDSMEKLHDLMNQINEKDAYTKKHCTRVWEWMPVVVKKLNISNDKVLDLINAALFHDVGKLDIRSEVLKKPGSLTDEEFAEVKGHPTAGRIILEDHQMDRIGKIIEQHHERIDGSGYPHHLKGDSICIEARIIAVVDSFDAMTSDRPYRMALTEDEAIEELIEGKGSLYDERIVDVFLEVLKESKK